MNYKLKWHERFGNKSGLMPGTYSENDVDSAIQLFQGTHPHLLITKEQDVLVASVNVGKETIEVKGYEARENVYYQNQLICPKGTKFMIENRAGKLVAVTMYNGEPLGFDAEVFKNPNIEKSFIKLT